MLQDLDNAKASIEISWVPGHMEIDGNDRVDELAKEVTDSYKPPPSHAKTRRLSESLNGQVTHDWAIRHSSHGRESANRSRYNENEVCRRECREVSVSEEGFIAMVWSGASLRPNADRKLVTEALTMEVNVGGSRLRPYRPKLEGAPVPLGCMHFTHSTALDNDTSPRWTWLFLGHRSGAELQTRRPTTNAATLFETKKGINTLAELVKTRHTRHALPQSEDSRRLGCDGHPSMQHACIPRTPHPGQRAIQTILVTFPIFYSLRMDS
jgi:hypothetical protein